jgi:hypothetical protein
MRAIDCCVLFAAPIVAVCSLVADGGADTKAHKEIELDLDPPALVDEAPAVSTARTHRAQRMRPSPGVRRARPPGLTTTGAPLYRR